MVVFKSILADPYVIITCLKQVRMLYRDMFQMMDLRSRYFENLAQRIINESCARWTSGAPSLIDDALQPLPPWVADTSDIGVSVFAFLRFLGAVMICDLKFLMKYMKRFIDAHYGERFVAFMHFAKITQFACENGVSYQRTVSEPMVVHDWKEYVGKGIDPATLFSCLVDGTVNADIISKMKALRADKHMANYMTDMYDSDDSLSSSLGDVTPLQVDEQVLPAPQKLSKNQRRKRNLAAKKAGDVKKLAKASNALKQLAITERQRRKNQLSTRISKTLNKQGGLKPKYAKVARNCCKIYLQMGKCAHAKTGLCGPGTSNLHQCVCGGPHSITKCKKQLYMQLEQE